MTDALSQLVESEQAAGRPALCMWMQAGVVDYKLCDREFDCEHCSFDAAFREGAHSATNVAAAESFPFVESSHSRHADEPSLTDGYAFEGALFYHPAHVWARVEEGGSVRAGLDDFGQKLLGRVYSVELPSPGAGVVCGRPCWSVAHSFGETALASPVTGRVREVNTRLAGQPSLVNREPYRDGWAFVVEPDGLEESLKRLGYGETARVWREREMKKLDRKVEEILGRELSGGSPEGVGQTMRDGGARSRDFMSELGVAQARELIGSFFPARQSGGKMALHEVQMKRR